MSFNLNAAKLNPQSLRSVSEEVSALQSQREDGVEERPPLLAPVVLHHRLQQLQRLAVLLGALQLFRHRHRQMRLTPGRPEGPAIESK